MVYSVGLFVASSSSFIFFPFGFEVCLLLPVALEIVDETVDFVVALGESNVDLVVSSSSCW